MEEAVVDFLGAIFGGDASHWTVLASIFMLSWVLCGRHLKRKDDIPLRQFLETGGLEPFYRKRLAAILGWFDRYLTPPGHRDIDSPQFTYVTSPARAWNWLAYDRMLLFAVIYPIALPVVIWTLTGTPAYLGETEVMSTPDHRWQQATLGLALLVIAFSRPLARVTHSHLFYPVLNRLSHAILARPAPPELGFDLVLGALIVAAAVAGAGAAAVAAAVAVAGAVAAAAAVAFAGAGAFAGAFAAAVAGAGAAAVAAAVAVAFAAAAAGAFAAAVAGAGAAAVAGAVAVAFAAAAAVERAAHKPLAYMLLTIAEFSLLGVVVSSGLLLDVEYAGSILLFLGLFPLVNAIWDFLSLGLTRWCLRQSLVDAPWRGLPAALRPLIFNLCDLVGAVLSLAGLVLSLLIGLSVMNHLAPEPLLPLDTLFADLRGREGGPDMTWAYLMVFSTLLPTAAHLLLFLISLPMRFPSAFGRRLLAQWIATADDGDDRIAGTCFVMAAWATLWFAIPILGWVYLMPHTGTWHDNALGWMIDAAERAANVMGLR